MAFFLPFAGIPGGATGAAGSIWRNGSGVPDNSLGSDNDYYLDNNTGLVYWKNASVYTLVADIHGSVWRNGSGAPSNSLGLNGDYYINTATADVYYKAAGVYTVIMNIGP